jgi:hypothetical protein
MTLENHSNFYIVDRYFDRDIEHLILNCINDEITESICDLLKDEKITNHLTIILGFCSCTFNNFSERIGFANGFEIARQLQPYSE